MAKVTAARTAALDIMRAIRSGDLADRAFARQAEAFDAQDRAWLHELVYGTLRLRGRMDYVLADYVKKGLSSLDDDVLDILRLATYQILEMGGVPHYAAVSQAVEQTRDARKRSAGGLVNGVLNNVVRNIEITKSRNHEITTEGLVNWGAHPRWLVERWVARFGLEATDRLVSANNVKPDIFFRPIGVAAQSVSLPNLEKVNHAPDALRLTSGSVTNAFAAVPSIVQDPAAGLIARYAAPEGGVVADLCAAPGGKAIALADIIGDRGFVIAADVSAARLERARENARRIGGLNMQFTAGDARMPAIREADMVLIDAPCTGTGTFRRHPDGKWRVQPADLVALVHLQREILDGAAAAVKPGGILVYSTCSLEPEENQEQVTAFLDRHPTFLRRPPAGWSDASTIDEVGNLVVLPHVHGFDGSFAARLERVA